MKAFLRRYRATIVSFIGLTLPLFVLYVHGAKRERQTFLESALMSVTGPVQSVMNGVIEAVGGVWSDYIALVDLKRRNEELERKVDELEGQALENRQLRRENERLVGLCDFKRLRTELVTVPARVVSKDVSPFYRVVRVIIDVGEGPKVEEGMAVVTHRGVVGRVSRVSGRYADVMLTVDPRSHVDVKIAARGVNGTLSGRGNSNVYGSRFHFLHRGEPIKQGDEVITSGHDRVFPAGLTVGYIAEDKERQVGVYYEYDVVPAVNFSTLEEVLVVLNEQPEIPTFGGKKRHGKRR